MRMTKTLSVSFVRFAVTRYIVAFIIIIIIITSYAPISSKIKLSGATKPRG